MKHECCQMKGFLTYILLWIIKIGPKTGAEIAGEIENRKGKKPSPGTIYPALKELKEKGLIKDDKEKKYYLTKKGEKQLTTACSHFCKLFYDVNDMFRCCHQK
ncbi:PadR family transcriptional regulator [Candidatus Altiarchaeota archaeon]